MRISIISGTPKTDGLCQSVVEEVKQGIIEANAEIDEIRLCDMGIERCRVCGNGWGTCIKEQCTFGDDGFNEVIERIKESDAIIIATPVYWGETSEALKSFLDRLRRYDFQHKEIVNNKQVLLIAVPGGTGNGMLSCLEQMDRFCRHTGAQIFDYIGVNRWNCDYKRIAARNAAYAMASGRRNGDTIK